MDEIRIIANGSVDPVDKLEKAVKGYKSSWTVFQRKDTLKILQSIKDEDMWTDGVNGAGDRLSRAELCKKNLKLLVEKSEKPVKIKVFKIFTFVFKMKTKNKSDNDLEVAKLAQEKIAAIDGIMDRLKESLVRDERLWSVQRSPSYFVPIDSRVDLSKTTNKLKKKVRFSSDTKDLEPSIIKLAKKPKKSFAYLEKMKRKISKVLNQMIYRKKV